MSTLFRRFAENYLKPKRFLFLWMLAVVLNIIAFLLVFLKSGLKGSHVALRYTIKAGVLWYGEGKNLYTLPFLGLLANFINFILFKKLASQESFLRHAVVLTSLFVQVILLFGLILLSTIN
ncbi:MAG: hypothetical protein HYZ51_01625 [Candidatus Doudnabacteria bacterium]|nr:hypothetical protein [Candidatus Doudnabacteria bacterium]